MKKTTKLILARGAYVGTFLFAFLLSFFAHGFESSPPKQSGMFSRVGFLSPPEVSADVPGSGGDSVGGGDSGGGTSSAGGGCGCGCDGTGCGGAGGCGCSGDGDSGGGSGGDAGGGGGDGGGGCSGDGCGI